MYRMNVRVLELVKRLDIYLRILVENRVSSRYKSIFKGKGLEFEEYKSYSTTDDANTIDWKASARANDLLVKRFREERSADVFFLLDVSSSMVFGSTDKLKNEYAAEFVASLSNFILQAGDNVGLIMFNDRIVNTLVAGGGTSQFYLMMRSLVNPVFYGGGYNLTQAISFLMKMSKRRGLLFIVSDFIGLEQGWERSVMLASTMFDVVGVMVRDPRDRELPKGVGQVVISNPFTGKTMLIDPDEVGDDYKRYAMMQEARIRNAFRANNADLIELVTDKPFLKPLINFFRGREILM